MQERALRQRAYSYDAEGRVTGFNYGNGVAASYSYSPNRSQPTTLGYSKGATNLFSLKYWYQMDSTNCPSGNNVGNNSQIQCIPDGVDGGRTASYSYDALGRIATASTNGSSAFARWGLSWGYDRYGNRLSQTVTAGSGYNNLLTFSFPGGGQRNQPDGWCFDASGNLLAKSGACPPAAPHFVYDGENRMVSDPTAGATYVYDGSGTRVQKCMPNCTSPTSSTAFIFSGGRDIAEYDNGATVVSPSREFIYSTGISGTGLLASISAGAITYFHSDHLDWRVSTDVIGSKNGEQGHYPFGESWYSSNGNEFVFTSYQRDSESGLDYAMARYYDSSAGRFCSADPVGGDADDPQTWNRYAYGRNDPIDKTDPSGKNWWEPLAIAILSVFPATQPAAALLAEDYELRETGKAIANGQMPPLFGGSIGSAPSFSMPSDDGAWNEVPPLPTQSLNPSAIIWNYSNGIPLFTPAPPGPPPGLAPRTCQTTKARVVATVNRNGATPSGAFQRPVQPGSAAVAPSQWDGGKSALKYLGPEISGAAGDQQFHGVDDVIGPPSDQKKLLQKNPGSLLLELSTGKDIGRSPAVIRVPSEMKCPKGTAEIGRAW